MGDYKITASIMNDCKLGNSQVDKIYLGNELLWSKHSSGYGILYNWAVTQDSRNIAPIEWHVPTIDEWNTLISFLGGSYVAGGKLKETGFIHWANPNNASDLYGLSIKGSGERRGETFMNLNTMSRIHTYSVNGQYNYLLDIYNNSTIIQSSYGNYRLYGASIYLVRDNSNNTGFLVDIDSNVYPSINIGGQIWAGPIKTTRYRDGTNIPEILDDYTWTNTTNTGARCAYNNDNSFI